MAEIKIKKKSPIWPWIVLSLIVVAAIAYYFLVYNEGTINDETPNIRQNNQMENGTGMNDKILDRIWIYNPSDDLV